MFAHDIETRHSRQPLIHRCCAACTSYSSPLPQHVCVFDNRVLPRPSCPSKVLTRDKRPCRAAAIHSPGPDAGPWAGQLRPASEAGSSRSNADSHALDPDADRLGRTPGLVMATRSVMLHGSEVEHGRHCSDFKLAADSVTQAPTWPPAGLPPTWSPARLPPTWSPGGRCSDPRGVLVAQSASPNPSHPVRLGSTQPETPCPSHPVRVTLSELLRPSHVSERAAAPDPPSKQPAVHPARIHCQ
jgi:hypothetical protein